MPKNRKPLNVSRLSQQLPREEKCHLVVFYSKSLSPVEWNYEVHDKKMLAIIHALEE